MRKKLRVAAYAVCVRDDHLLMARWVAGDGPPLWTLPGGGLEHGEDPYDAVRREVEEETGYLMDVTALLGVGASRRLTPPRLSPRRLRRGVDGHAVRVLYEGRITGGDLRDEIGGSTDRAAWHPLAEVPDLHRSDAVDIALALWRQRPATGRLAHPDPEG
ncbi:NUDIX hydrolase [Streptomyces griseoviridis]|uniref:NUDIX hydrolase n=1 Tax=Streptomyces griseoviridis TaxID=45398 RepID=UPI0034002AD3